MRPTSDLPKATRRAIVKAAAGALGFGAVGAAGAHPGDDHPTVGLRSRRFPGNEPEEVTNNVALESYHSLGGGGPESVGGDEAEPHYGGLSEFRIGDDLAVVGVFSARRPTPQRGLAVLDIGDFTRAESQEQLDNASLSVLSFVRNDNAAAAWMDVKLSNDENYAFVSQQPFSALFAEADDGVTTDGDGADPDAKGALVVDLTDPTEPEVVAKGEGQSPTGPHNGWYHQVGGREYMFTNAGDVYEFHRDPHRLEPVSFWDYSGHDLVVQDDPRYGIPILYLSDWDGGLRLFDVSDPAVDDVTERELGVFRMFRSHHSLPAPTLLDGKRLAVAGQENPRDEDDGNAEGGQSGYLYLVDCDPIDAVIEGEEEGPVDLGAATQYKADDSVEVDPDADTELDSWALFESLGDDWKDVPGFHHEHKREQDPDDDFGQYDGYPDYNLSTHNLDITPDGQLVIGCYHAGTRFLEITDHPSPKKGFALEETGYYRRFRDIPLDACLEELLRATPFFWSAVARNGVAFSGGINSGAHVIGHDDFTVGEDTVLDADVALDIDSVVYTAGRTAHLRVSVDSDEPTRLRTRLEPDLEVLAGDDHSVQELTNSAGEVVETVITFAGTHTDGTLQLFVQLPDETGSYVFGPAEYARTDPDAEFGGGNANTNRLWRKANGETATATVVGVDD
jgi:hypothetical protein